MNLSDTAQELLEQLWTATKELGQTGLVIGDALPEGADELARCDLVTRENGLLKLTARGRPEAAGSVRRHRLAERLLADVLSSAEERLDAQACRLEHALFDGLDEAICTLLGHPRFCPHGKPIPRGRCCERMTATVGRLIATLCDLEPGQAGYIAYIQTGTQDRMQKLMAMGVLPGVPIRLTQRFPSFAFEAGYSQFAVDEQIAADIYVRVTGSAPPPGASEVSGGRKILRGNS